MRAKAILDGVDAALVAVLKWICVAAFAAITLIITADILVRAFPVTSMHWKDEIVEALFAAMVFYGAAAVWIKKGHFSAGDWIGKLLKGPRAKAALRLAIDLLSAAFIVVFLRYSAALVGLAREMTNVFQIPRKYLYLCMPVSAAIMALYSVKFIVQDIVWIIKPRPEHLKEEEAV